MTRRDESAPARGDERGTGSPKEIEAPPIVTPGTDTEGWTAVRGLANRRRAAVRMAPLATGHRDPATRRPSDAPDPEQQRLWELAALIAASADAGDPAGAL